MSKPATPSQRRQIDAKSASLMPFVARYRLSTGKVVLSVRKAHPLEMAKTWMPKNDVKFTKAFAKAMRGLNSPKGGRRPKHSRPR